MDRQLSEWNVEIERIWSAVAPDYGEAVRIATHIATAGEEAVLRQAASQALPILRSAAHHDADRITRDAARRRLAVLRDVLHAFITPQFGKRQAPAKSSTPEEGYRQLLGLPLGCRLSGSEIHRAYKRLAKRAHPDAGGNVKAFQELSAARDALMQEQRARPRN
ncbi:MAG: DnaJ domain-containing protein [Bradyrhizobium sp.]